MSFDADEIYEKANSQVPEQEKPWFDEGMDRGRKAYENNEVFNPDLSHFVTNAQKQAFVKGYTTAVRMSHEFDLEAIRELEAFWDYEEVFERHPNQKKFDDFIVRRSEGIPSSFQIHFDRGFNMTCHDKKREHFFTDEQKTSFLANMNNAFKKGAAAGYEAQCDDFDGAEKFQFREVWGEL